MPTPEYYRNQAARFRRLASMAYSQEATDRLSKAAEEYERLATELENTTPDGQSEYQQQHIQPEDKE